MGPIAETRLLALQGSIKRDPESYEEEFALQLRHYKAALGVFSLKPSEEFQEFAELATFIAQVSYCYPEQTADFAEELSSLLDKHYAVLNSQLRQTLVKALILLRNRNQVSALEILPLFFRLFKCQDKSLRQLLFRHIIADIKAANKKHHNDSLNRAIQNFLYGALEDPHEAAAKKSLAVLIELWQRQVWRDARTVNVIASAAVHKSSRIMLAALKFFLGQDEDSSADSDNEDEDAVKLVQPTKADVYKATKKGTAASKKKKEKKLQRVLAAIKKHKRKSRPGHENFAAIQLLHDPQKFAEELFKRLNKSSGERFEVRLAMMSVISRVTGVHKLLLLNFYPFLQRYMLPHQRDAPIILAIAVQAVHEEVPPDVIAPLLRQLVDQFVHDRARPEVMSLGLKSVRSLCERAPLVMTPELLQDLVLYKKFREKEVASAARGLITLFRELAPGMLEKKDRGRDADLQAVPMAYGARPPAARVEGAELLQAALERGDKGSESGLDEDDGEGESSEGELDEDSEAELEEYELSHKEPESGASGDEEDQQLASGDDLDLDSDARPSDDENQDNDSGDDAVAPASSSETGSRDSQGNSVEADGDKDGEDDDSVTSKGEEQIPEPVDAVQKPEIQGTGAKRKLGSTEGSLSSLRREVRAKLEPAEADVKEPESTPLEYERILDENDFSQIRQLRHEKMVKDLMRKHGLKSAAKRERLLAAAEDEAEEALAKKDMQMYLTEQRMDPDELKGKHKSRKSKADRLKSVMEGREGREFGAAAARKQKKTGGKSNKEKLKGKNLPLGARKAVVQRRGRKQKVGKKNFSAKKKRLP